ncbi:MAG: crotonase/enoyl-CoA hydratase family protein [Burkholderiaceae bacterium]
MDAGDTDTVLTEVLDDILVVTINRPQVRNAVDAPTALALAKVMREFDRDPRFKVAVLEGAQGSFCAGADLKAVSQGRLNRVPELNGEIARDRVDAPMGLSYLRLDKPVIAAVAGHAVAGGLELAIWCDLRVAEEDAVFGVYCRRWGVPLIDGGTVRLPRLIGHSHAMDMILTGRPVGATEALAMGLANRVVPRGQARAAAISLAQSLCRFPQTCLRHDRRSALDQWGADFDAAMVEENRLGRLTLASGETHTGANRFASGHGRGGSFDDL